MEEKDYIDIMRQFWEANVEIPTIVIAVEDIADFSHFDGFHIKNGKPVWECDYGTVEILLKSR